jgi:hypothetical protein
MSWSQGMNCSFTSAEEYFKHREEYIIGENKLVIQTYESSTVMATNLPQVNTS